MRRRSLTAPKNHIGCIAVYHNVIIGVGYNAEKTHPRQKKYNMYRDLDNDCIDPVPKVHAEIMCLNTIAKMDIDFSKVHLYIYRIRQDQPLGLSRPCAACMRAIKDFGIKNIHYTTNDGFAYEKLI